MTSNWMPGAKVMPGPKDGGSMTGGEKLVTWHFFVSPLTMSASSGMRYLHDHGTTVHFTFNVLTGEVVQGIPANRAGRGLMNQSGGVQTNRRGTYNIQIEVMANSPHWWKELTPAGKAGLAKMMAYFRSLGIPDQWAGIPGNTHDTPNGKSGHTGHNNWVENDHNDYLSKAPWELVGDAPAPKPSSPSYGKYLTITGELNSGTVRLLQRWVGATEDGILGPDTIKGLQRKAGVAADGAFGPASARALEKLFGLKVESIPGWYPGLIRGLQKALNEQIKAGKL